MGRWAREQQDDAAQVLRSIWGVTGQTADDLDDDCGPTKACRNMRDVSFDGMAEPGTDLAQAWRDRLRREGKLSAAGGVGPRPRPRLGGVGERRGPLSLAPGPGVPDSVAALSDQLRTGGYLADRGLSTALFVALSLHRPAAPRGRGRRRQDRGGEGARCGLRSPSHPAAVLRGHRHQPGAVRVGLRPPDAADPGAVRARPRRRGRRGPAVRARGSSSSGRCWRRCAPATVRCCSSTRSTARTTSSRRSCSSCCPTSRSPSRRSAPSSRRRRRSSSSPRTARASCTTRSSAAACTTGSGTRAPSASCEIVLVRAPGASEALARKVVAAVNRLRELDLSKPPGVAETIDWVRTLEVARGRRPGRASGPRHPRRRREGPRRRSSWSGQAPKTSPVAPDGSAGVDVEAEQPFAALLVDFARELRAAGVGGGHRRRGDVLRRDGAAGPHRPARPVLGRPHHARHPARATSRCTTASSAPSSCPSARTLPEPLQLSVRAQEQAQGVLEVPADGAGRAVARGAGGQARPAGVGRRRAPAQVVRTCTPEELAAAAPHHAAHAADAAAPPHPPDRARPARAYPRHAPDGPRDDAHPRGAGAAVLARASAAAAAAGPHPGRVRLDGRLLAAPAAVRVLDAAAERPGRGVLLRHPADPDHPGAAAPPPRRGDRARRRRRRRLGRRHPDR